MLANIEGEFLVDSTYSEFPSLPQKMDSDVTSLSGLSYGMIDVF